VEIRIIRSARRKKTVSGRLVDGIFEIRVPEHLSNGELESVICQLVRRIQRRAKLKLLDDAALEQRARELNRIYLDGKAAWSSIRWVMNQSKRFGSCTPARGTIRISHCVAEMPPFVRDYVILHELAHLIEPGHSPAFWAWVTRFPRAERARGYLMAVGLERVEE